MISNHMLIDFLINNKFFKIISFELISISFVKFILELDPMQSQGMQEALHTIHADNNAECNPTQHPESTKHLYN